MEVLLVFLLLSHLGVLIFFWRYINAYKTNNHNYISSELKKLNSHFNKGISSIDSKISEFTKKSNQSFSKLAEDQEAFNEDQKAKMREVTQFIKSDYQSLTQLLKHNNDLLSKLLKRTQENISKNEELKPLLVNSNDELEKVYSKIKLLISNYEKNLKNITQEMKNTLTEIENMSITKLKEITSEGEKSISDSMEISRDSIESVTEFTNAGLRKLLKENQIKLFADSLDSLKEEIKAEMTDVTNSIQELDNSLLEKLKQQQRDNKDRKGFFGL